MGLQVVIDDSKSERGRSVKRRVTYRAFGGIRRQDITGRSPKV